MKVKIYRNTITKKRVYEDEAFDYAMKSLKLTMQECKDICDEQEEYKEMLVEWFYSGNWIEEWEDMD